jgi:hypothetical protein
MTSGDCFRLVETDYDQWRLLEMVETDSDRWRLLETGRD